LHKLFCFSNLVRNETDAMSDEVTIEGDPILLGEHYLDARAAGVPLATVQKGGKGGGGETELLKLIAMRRKVVSNKDLIRIEFEGDLKQK
jgi:hypothetical protein